MPETLISEIYSMPPALQKKAQHSRNKRKNSSARSRKQGRERKGLTTIEKGGVVKDIPSSAEALMKLKGKRTKVSESPNEARGHESKT